jgi:hypothetical protein
MKAMVVNDENAKDATPSMDLRSRVALSERRWYVDWIDERPFS